MHIEVDQSGKIGKTNEDTVLAFSNDEDFAILIPRKVKQECLRVLRSQGLSPEAIYLRLFVIGLYFLLRQHITKAEWILIDTEYLGKDKQIKERLYNLLRRSGVIPYKQQITFGFIGKESRAHSTAIATFRRERKADIILTAADLLSEF